MFDLLIDELEGLGEHTSPDAKPIARLLDRLSAVNAFALIADVEVLRLKLFSVLMKVIRFAPSIHSRRGPFLDVSNTRSLPSQRQAFKDGGGSCHLDLERGHQRD